MPTRLLIVALDSAEPLMVKELVKKGLLPTIQALLDKGQSADIENFPGFGNGVFWPSINSGVDPSYHGRYFRRQPRPGTYSLEPFLEKDFKSPPFWKALDENGLLTAVVDPVESPAAHPETGIEIMEWMTHGRVESARSTPPQLIDEIIACYGDDHYGGNADLAVKKGLSPEEAINLGKQRIKKKTEAMLDLLDRNDWDLFYVTYADPHDIGHVAWHLHEPRQGDKSQNQNKMDVDPVEQCYQALDKSLSRLMETVLPGGQTIVLMGPGIETHVSANSLLSDILRAFQGRTSHGLINNLKGAMRRFIQSPRLPASFGKHLKTVRARMGYRVKTLSGARYFSVPHNDNAGCIRINLTGRDPHGVVSQGQEYDDLCSELTERLLLLRDASGDVPLVSKIVKLHDHYSGPSLDLMPDLMVIWNREADVSAVSSSEISKLINRSTSIRTGDHSTRGLLISSLPINVKSAVPLTPLEVTPILVQAVNYTAETTTDLKREFAK
ncbi:MAG: alkaline phosphatase family protein [Arenicellales bacterium]